MFSRSRQVLPIGWLSGGLFAAQCAHNQGLDGNIVEDRDDQVRPCLLKQRRIIQAGEPDRAHSASLGRLNACGRILDDDAVGSRHLKLFRRQQEQIGRRFPLLDIPASDVDLENIQKVDLARLLPVPGRRVQPNSRHHVIGVLGRRGGRHSKTLATGLANKAQRVGKRLKLAARDQVFDQRLLRSGVLNRAARGIRNLEIIENGARTTLPRLAGNVPLIDRGIEALGGIRTRRRNPPPVMGHKMGQRVLPCPLVRRGDKNAIHIKNKGRQPPRRVRLPVYVGGVRHAESAEERLRPTACS